MAEVTLAFIARQLEEARAERAAMRDDMQVLLAIVQRLDGTVQGLVAEVRAQHARHDRLARQVAEHATRLPEPSDG